LSFFLLNSLIFGYHEKKGGIGTEVLSKLLVIFHGMKGVDYIALSPYPSEYEKLRVEKFFEKFNFQQYASHADNQQDIMRLKTFDSSHKLSMNLSNLSATW
jgi:hypothetical protein